MQSKDDTIEVDISHAITPITPITPLEMSQGS